MNRPPLPPLCTCLRTQDGRAVLADPFCRWHRASEARALRAVEARWTGWPHTSTCVCLKCLTRRQQ